MMLLLLLGLIATMGWLNKPRLGSLSDATKGAGVAGDD